MEAENYNDQQGDTVVAGSYLAVNIRCLRKRKGLSQDELAQSIGLNRGNIASYEKASAEPKICNLLKMSSLFQVPVRDLTQNDLSEEVNLLQAFNNYQQIEEGHYQFLKEYKDRSHEIESYLHSIHHCYQFKANVDTELTADARSLQAFYEQMREAAQSLLRQHQSLIDFVSCKGK